MKIKFTEAPRGRPYKVGEIVEFIGPVPEGYARKYINRGWAIEYQEPVKIAPAAPAEKVPDGPMVGKPPAASTAGGKPTQSR